MVDFIEVRQRVAATEEKLKAANALGRHHDARLTRLLQSIEANLTRTKTELASLRQDRAAAQEEIRELKSLLQKTLAVTESSAEAPTGLSARDLDVLLTRLGSVVANANRELESLRAPTGAPAAPAADEVRPEAEPGSRRFGPLYPY